MHDQISGDNPLLRLQTPLTKPVVTAAIKSLQGCLAPGAMPTSPPPSGPIPITVRLDGLDQNGRTLEAAVIAGSEKSLAALLPMYLHQSTAVTVLLGSGVEAFALRATVGPAAHVSGRAHVCLLRLDEPTSLELLGFKGDRDQPVQSQATQTNARAKAADPSKTSNGPDRQLEGAVLSLDDDELQRKLIAKQLEPTQLELLTAETIGQALDAVTKQPIDIALVDLNLTEGSSGENFVKTARQKGFTRPIIAVTGIEDMRRLGDLYDIGVTDLLRKPHEPEDLRGIIENHLRAYAYTAGQSPIPTTNPDPDAARFADAVNERASEIATLASTADAQELGTTLSEFADDARNAGCKPLACAARDAALAAAASNAAQRFPVALVWLTHLAKRVAHAHANAA